jgi:hypothetical protein
MATITSMPPIPPPTSTRPKVTPTPAPLAASDIASEPTVVPFERQAAASVSNQPITAHRGRWR